MRQYLISGLDKDGRPAGHYAASSNCLNDTVLVQIQDEFGCQVRIKLTKDEAKHLSNLILEAIESIKK